MMLTDRHCVPCAKGTAPLAPEQAKALLKDIPGWNRTDDGKWLTKHYKFKNFVQALAFVNRVGDVAEAEQHHPDLTFGWGYAEIKLQTHAAGGLHENDFIMAARIDRIQ